MSPHDAIQGLVEPKPEDALGPDAPACLVCVGRDTELLRAPALSPLGGPGFEPHHRVELVRASGLAALLVRVERSYFVGPEAQERLADLAWLAPRAVRHEELIRFAMETGPVLPLPFATLFSTAPAVQRALSTHARPIHDFLSLVEGCVELSVRVALDRPRALTALTDRLSAQAPPAAGPGARYLAQRKLREQAQRELDAHAASNADALLAPFAALARRSVHRRSVAHRDDGLTTSACLALLVPLGSLPAIEALAQRQDDAARELGQRVQLTGPWPPYSFCPSLSAQHPDDSSHEGDTP